MSEKTQIFEKAAREEELIRDVLLAEGVHEAYRTPGGRKSNRKNGDIVLCLEEGQDPISIEAQISPGDPGRRKNYTLNAGKVTQFEGQAGDATLCYYLLGNDHWKDYVIVPKPALDAVLTAYDGCTSDKDVVLMATGEYYVISRIGLAHSGLSVASGDTLEACVKNFVRRLRG